MAGCRNVRHSRTKRQVEISPPRRSTCLVILFPPWEEMELYDDMRPGTPQGSPKKCSCDWHGFNVIGYRCSTRIRLSFSFFFFWILDFFASHISSLHSISCYFVLSQMANAELFFGIGEHSFRLLAFQSTMGGLDLLKPWICEIAAMTTRTCSPICWLSDSLHCYYLITDVYYARSNLLVYSSASHPEAPFHPQLLATLDARPASLPKQLRKYPNSTGTSLRRSPSSTFLTTKHRCQRSIGISSTHRNESGSVSTRNRVHSGSHLATRGAALPVCLRKKEEPETTLLNRMQPVLLHVGIRNGCLRENLKSLSWALGIQLQTAKLVRVGSTQRTGEQAGGPKFAVCKDR